MDKFISLFPKSVRLTLFALIGIGGIGYFTLKGLAWAEESVKKVAKEQAAEQVKTEVKAAVQETSTETDNKIKEVNDKVEDVKKGQKKQYTFLKCALIVHAKNGSADKMLECDKSDE